MLKYIETTGKNEDDAIQAALRQLGLDRDEVSVELLERAKSGFLGIGSSPAKVRVSYEAPDEPVAPPVQPEPKVVAEKPKAKPQAAEQPKAEAKPAPKAERAPVQPQADGEDRTQAIATFLTGLMQHMEVSATPSIRIKEDGSYQVNLEGENLGALIGRRGETLDAIQQLTSYSVNRGRTSRVRIHLDAEHYRARREESLERLAKKMAGKALKYRRSMTLEPMNAYERHVIHTALQDYRGVSTHSVGTEPNRRVVVSCD